LIEKDVSVAEDQDAHLLLRRIDRPGGIVERQNVVQRSSGGRGETRLDDAHRRGQMVQNEIGGLARGHSHLAGIVQRPIERKAQPFES